MGNNGVERVGRVAVRCLLAAAALAGCSVVEAIDNDGTTTSTAAPGVPDGVGLQVSACIDAVHLSAETRTHVTIAVADAIAGLGAVPDAEADGQRPTRQAIKVTVHPIVGNSVSTEVPPIASGTILALAGLPTPKPKGSTHDDQRAQLAWRVADADAMGEADERRRAAEVISGDLLAWQPTPPGDADIAGCITASARDFSEPADHKVLVLATDLNADGTQNVAGDLERAAQQLPAVDVLVVQSCIVQADCEAGATGIEWWVAGHGAQSVEILPANTPTAELAAWILERSS